MSILVKKISKMLSHKIPTDFNKLGLEIHNNISKSYENYLLQNDSFRR